jgi:CHASE3 domain sensor protein
MATDRRLTLAGLFASTLIWCWSGGNRTGKLREFGEASEARKHSHEVLMTINETEARLVDAETGQRGYLLTGDPAYLAPYRKPT